jgi:plastocyanin
VLVIAADITAFHVIGAILAIWAVLVSALGVMRHDFPGSKVAERAVIAITALLVVGTIGAGVTTSDEAEAEHGGSGEVGHAVNKEGEHGSEAPEQGGTPAPDTAPESGQESAGETGQDAPPGNAVTTLELTADPDNGLSFDKAELEAKAGNVRITMTNPAQLPHDVSLEGPGGVDEQGEEVPQGGSSEVEAELEPGEYVFYCSVDGHRDEGMEGTLTVTE